MNAALVDSGFTAPGLEAELAGFDAVLSLEPNLPSRAALSDLEYGACFTELPRIMDDWATALANAVLLEGRPVGFPEREYCRLALTAFLMRELGRTWVTADAFLAGLPGRVKSLAVFSERKRLAELLREKWGRRATQVEWRPPVLDGVGRLARFRERVVRHAAFRASQWRDRLNGLRRRGPSEAVLARARRTTRPVVLMYLLAGVNYFTLRRTAGLLREAGYEVLFVDWSDDYLRPVEKELAGSLIRFWSLRAWQTPLAGPPPRVEFDSARCPAGGEIALLLRCFGEAMRAELQAAEEETERHARAHQEIWAAVSPRVLVACEDYLRGARLNVVAARQGLPTVDVAHAFQNPWQRNYAYTTVALFGPQDIAANRAREEPPPSCRLAATGPCRYDDIFFGQFTSKEKIRAELELPAEAPVVLFASQYLWGGDLWFRELKERALRWLAESLPEHALLVVKKHQLETGDLTERILAAILPARRYRITHHADLYGLLKVCRVMVTLWSNAATEAVLFDKPVLLLDNPQLALLPYVRSGVATVVRSAAELRDQLRALTTGEPPANGADGEARRRFIGECLTAFDGRASERLARLVGELDRGRTAGGLP